MSLRDAFTRHPDWIATSLEKYLDKGRNQNTQHRQWTEILPTYQPIETRPVAGHQFDIVGKSEIIATHRNTCISDLKS